ncbi:hypothetical protein ACQKWADRAFT_172261 [Trichoderma austrokoningii]
MSSSRVDGNTLYASHRQHRHHGKIHGHVRRKKEGRFIARLKPPPVNQQQPRRRRRFAKELNPLPSKYPSNNSRGWRVQRFGSRRVLCTNAARLLPAARLTGVGCCFSVQESGSDQIRSGSACIQQLRWSHTATEYPSRYCQILAISRYGIESIQSASSLHPSMAPSECYNTCMHSASTFRTWAPEHHASPHPDRRLHAAVPPVFHVALLVHHTATDTYHLNFALPAGSSASLWPRYKLADVGSAALKRAPSSCARMSLRARAGCDDY